MSKLVTENGKTRETIWNSVLRRWVYMKKGKPEPSDEKPRKTKKTKDSEEKPKLPDKQLTYLRKTGSTKLRSDLRFVSLDSLYLGMLGQH